MKTQWVPEIKHHRPGIPWILVGTKSDLRDNDSPADNDDDDIFITTEEAEKIVKKLNGTEYIECSSRKMRNVKHVFDQGIRYVCNMMLCYMDFEIFVTYCLYDFCHVL